MSSEITVHITEKALNKLKELLVEEIKTVSDTKGLRIYVKGGGCSGYQYGMNFERIVSEEDNILTKDGIQIIIDSQSASLIHGAEMDYLDGLHGSGFSIKNPNAKSTCGCGSSFTI